MALFGSICPRRVVAFAVDEPAPVHSAGASGGIVGNSGGSALNLAAGTPQGCAICSLNPPLKLPVPRRNGAINLGKIAVDSPGDTKPRMYLSQ